LKIPYRREYEGEEREGMPNEGKRKITRRNIKREVQKIKPEEEGLFED
jgi:hypothetical protein